MRFAACGLLAAVVLCPRVLRAGVIDQNNNGLGDMWEMVFHASNLDPNADDDGDGFTNAREAAAGTDPRDPDSHPPRLSIAVSGGSATGTWNPVAGKQYSVQGSPSLGAGALAVSSSGTTGATTSLALRGPADPGQTGPVLAECVSAAPQSDGSYLWVITDPTAVAAVKAGRVYFDLVTATHPAGEIAGQLLRTAATGSFTPPAAPPAPPTTPPAAADAARLLTQATFGATAADLAAVQQNGYAAWVDAQLNAPPTLTLPYLDAHATSGQSLSANTFQEAWWKNAVTAPDQLRQRVAFALSEIFVVSDVGGNLSGSPCNCSAPRRSSASRSEPLTRIYMTDPRSYSRRSFLTHRRAGPSELSASLRRSGICAPFPPPPTRRCTRGP